MLDWWLEVAAKSLERGINMTKRRGRGEGAIYKKAENLWCAQLTTGYDGNATRKRRYVYGMTKNEVQKRQVELQYTLA